MPNQRILCSALAFFCLGMFSTTASAQASQAQCKNAYGQQACGFDCVAAYGTLRCAQTPAGRCQAASGQVTCWDPPGQIGLYPGAPKAECKSAYGRTACGYNCTASSGALKCSQTPSGVCQARSGRVTCWDPPAWVAPGGPQAQCITRGNEVTCGYHCLNRYGRIACAQTPNGVCSAERGRLSCWDPPAPVPGAFPITEQATCTTRFGKTACGYHCTARYGDVKCAQTPQGACQAAYGKVTCTR